MASDNMLKALVDGLTLTQSANYSAAAALTFLSYDICMTFFDEVKHIWSTRWSFAKALYFVGRYYGLIYLIVKLTIESTPGHSIHFCKVYWWYSILGGGIPFTIIVNMIFILRIYALYNRNRKVLLLFATLCLGESVCEIYACFGMATLTARAVIPSPPGVAWPGCLTIPPPEGSTLIAWIPAILVAWAFFLASLLRLRRSWRDAIALQAVRAENSRSPLVVVMIRDGTIYFSLILAILVICTTTTLVGNGSLYSTTAPWLIVVYSFSATQLILNLRRAAAREEAETFATTKTSRFRPKLSDRPKFAEPSSSYTLQGSTVFDRVA